MSVCTLIRVLLWASLYDYTSATRHHWVTQTADPYPITSWRGVDALHRVLPTPHQVGPLRHNKTVGVFYFLTQSAGQEGPFDNSRALQQAKGNVWNMSYGPPRTAHHWGSPLMGYYLSDDDWVLRKHGSMLSDAGVDFIAFDMTNAVTYDSAWLALLNAWSSMRSAGNKTPQVAIVLHAGTNQTITHMWHALYEKGLYEDMWFKWEGKPLVMGNISEVDPNIADHFTWRKTWAWTHDQGWFGTGQYAWPWIDYLPQGYGWSMDPRIPEQMPVACSGWPTMNLGRSYDGSFGNGGSEPAFGNASTAYGHYFRQQFSFALNNATCHESSFMCENLPTHDNQTASVLFVTGWNEWTATRFLVNQGDTIDFLGTRLRNGQSYFVDEFLPEYSRDIEPMVGGHTDNYYNQMTAFIRWYKGAVPDPRASSPKSISILSGDHTQWSDVLPIYTDTINDTNTRDHPGFGNTQIHYQDYTSLDDICEMQVMNDDLHIFFSLSACKPFDLSTKYPQCALFIDSSANQRGTLGFNMLVNISEAIAYNALAGTNIWQASMSNVPLAVTSSVTLQLSLPLDLVQNNARSSGILHFEFKWWCGRQSDVQLLDPLDFLLFGDSAPNSRFRFVYEQVLQRNVSSKMF